MVLLPLWYINYKQERLKPTDTDEIQMKGWCLYFRNTDKKWKLAEEVLQEFHPGTAFRMFAQVSKVWRSGRMCVSSPSGFMNPEALESRLLLKKLFCVFLCFWIPPYLLLFLHICWKKYTIYQCQEYLVSNTVRRQSEAPWTNGNSLSLHVNLFYKAHRPSWPMDISQLQAPNICLRCKEKLDAWKKKRFLKLRPTMVM